MAPKRASPMQSSLYPIGKNSESPWFYSENSDQSNESSCNLIRSLQVITRLQWMVRISPVNLDPKAFKLNFPETTQ